MVELTQHQEQALQEMLAFEKSDKKMFLLNGSAGTGKTTLIGEYCRRSSKQVILSGPTHKSSHVLQSKSIGYDVSTIHSLLNLTLEYEKDKTILVQRETKTKKSKTGNYLSTVVVDEASMLSDELISYIRADIARNNNRYIFVGDHCQLPPVDYDVSPVYNIVDAKFELTNIIRQAAGNPIIKLATAIRDMIQTGIIRDFEFEENDIGSVQSIDIGELIKLAKHYYRSSDYESNADFVKITAFTNEAVNKYNHFINKLFKVPEYESFIIGSKVVFNEAFAKGQRVIVPNNAEGTVKSIKKHVRDGIFFDTLEIDFEDGIVLDPKWSGSFDVIQQNSVSDYKRILNAIKSDAIRYKSWHKYYAYKDLYQDIRPNFSSTVHKLQGSTIDHIIIDLNDIMKCRDKNLLLKMLYVAVTRGAKNCYILS